jgi:hypothetical protein
MEFYTLKSGIPAFQVVDGEFAGRIYRPGEHYDAIPEAYAGQFEPVGEPADYTAAITDTTAAVQYATAVTPADPKESTGGE